MSHAMEARSLVAAASVGTLSTLAVDPAGHPYGSLVAYALVGASPVLLLSDLAEHTRNLRADPRASLTVAEPGEGPPLARGRVTVLGRASIADDDVPARDGYLAAHADAVPLAGFKDFHFWRLDVEAARYIAGFGKMSWVDAAAWATVAPDPLAPHAASILAHMNADHADTLVLYSRVLAGAPDAHAAVMTAVDQHGFELRADAAAGSRTLRIPFSRPVTTPDEVRKELVAMARRARGET